MSGRFYNSAVTLNRALARCLVFLLGVFLLSGCSNRQLFDAVQANRKLECMKLPQTQYDDCMNNARKSYDDYDKARKESTDK